MTRAARGVVVDTRASPGARLRPVPIGAVELSGGFWGPRLSQTRRATLPEQYARCEETGRIDNFRRAATGRPPHFQGRYYNDSDVYKWVEAVSHALAARDEPDMRRQLDGVVDAIAAAQQPGGYLNTYFTFERAAERYTDLANMHELYCAGHLIQAGIAHRRATGEARLFEVARRLADHVCAVFGPAGRPGADGHEGIELALVELYRETGEPEYLRRAGFFLDQRGRRPPLISGSPYHQDHLPVRDQREAVGHAVRATYLATAMMDVAMETGDAELREASEDLWRSAFGRKSYVTGGLGARYEGEAFGKDYELPNEQAYAETCAGVGGIMWSGRMLTASGDARYADQLETTLYNAALAGISLDGRRFFYVNPLADRARPAGADADPDEPAEAPADQAAGWRRQAWFDCACCPPNIARLLASLPGYLYGVAAGEFWLHLYAAGTVHAPLPGRGRAVLRVDTEYPWRGEVRITVLEAPGGEWALRPRVPAWAEGASLRVNGLPAAEAAPGRYANMRRAWRRGDVMELDIPLAVRRVASHPSVTANRDRVALMRGPVVYCLESCDHEGLDVDRLALPPAEPLKAEFRPDLLGGVTALSGAGVTSPERQPGGPLLTGAAPRSRPLTAVPYFAWANRAPGSMAVWIRTRPN